MPLLRKDFIVDEYQLVEAVACGADAVLLIVGALDDERSASCSRRPRRSGWRRWWKCTIATSSTRASTRAPTIVGVNSRNLRTLAVDLSVLDRGGRARCRQASPPSPRAASATPSDIERLSALGYHAFLVGERLIDGAGSGRQRCAVRPIAEALKAERS